MRLFPQYLRCATAVVVVICMSFLQVSPALAGLTPSQTSGTTSITSARDADMVVATRALENKVVAQKLHDYGMNAADTQAKLASMSDRDLHTLASASRGLPSGGDGTTGAIIGVLVVVILVIIVLRMTHHDVVVR